MSTIDDFRQRLNPRRLSVTDVMAGEWGIERRRLRIYQHQHPSAVWSESRSVALLSLYGPGLYVLMWASIRMFRG